MRINTWWVTMYGVNLAKLETRELNEEEQEEFGCNEVNDIDFVSQLVNNHPFLSWADNGQGSYYIGLTPKYPWEITPELSRISTKDVEDEIHKLLSPYVSNIMDIEFEDIDKEVWG